MGAYSSIIDLFCYVGCLFQTDPNWKTECFGSVSRINCCCCFANFSS